MIAGRVRGALRPLSVVVMAIALVLLIYGLLGYSVTAVVDGVLAGSVTSLPAAEQTLRWTVPLLLMGLGIAVAFKAGYFNVGAQGQMYVGAMASLVVGLWGDGRAPVLVVPLAFVAAVLAGAVWSLAAGLLRLLLGADEVVTSLMLNFVAVLLLQWATSGPLKSRAGTGQAATTESIDAGYRISSSTGTSLSIFVICAGAVAVTAILVNSTRTGLEISLVGRNPVMARWQGINSTGVGLLVFAFSGGCAGLAGAVEAFGPAGSLRAGFSPQVGFMAVVVALVGGLGAFGVLLAAVFFGALRAASLYLPVVTDLPQSGIDLLSGAIALLITVTAVPVVRRRQRRRRAPSTDGASDVPDRLVAQHREVVTR
ncbi:ABC transporter permease [Kribbella sp. NPDC050241]|uniref:ABC transporter permease n=1 Tax=Kribbella sp. NPDC050241 TaxID=3364115 RepID=UPI003798C139